MTPLSLSTLTPSKGSKTSSRRIGRGNSSSRGNYSGKGVKGQKARTGGRSGLKRKSFKYILQRIPKLRGFHSLKARPAVLNLTDIAVLDETIITPAVLKKHGLMSKNTSAVKILGNGEVKKAFTITGCLVSETVREKIQKAGGKVS